MGLDPFADLLGSVVVLSRVRRVDGGEVDRSYDVKPSLGCEFLHALVEPVITLVRRGIVVLLGLGVLTIVVGVGAGVGVVRLGVAEGALAIGVIVGVLVVGRLIRAI